MKMPTKIPPNNAKLAPRVLPDPALTYPVSCENPAEVSVGTVAVSAVFLVATPVNVAV